MRAASHSQNSPEARVAHPSHQRPIRPRRGPAGITAPDGQRTGRANWQNEEPGPALSFPHAYPAAKAHGRRCSAAKGGWHPGSGNDRQSLLWARRPNLSDRAQGATAGPCCCWAHSGTLGQHIWMPGGSLDVWLTAEGSGMQEDVPHGVAQHGPKSGQLRQEVALEPDDGLGPKGKGFDERR